MTRGRSVAEYPLLHGPTILSPAGRGGTCAPQKAAGTSNVLSLRVNGLQCTVLDPRHGTGLQHHVCCRCRRPGTVMPTGRRAVQVKGRRWEGGGGGGLRDPIAPDVGMEGVRVRRCAAAAGVSLGHASTACGTAASHGALLS